MSQQNPTVAELLRCSPEDTAAEPSVAFGVADGQRSGTGIHGDADNVYICVNGVDILQVTASGLIPTPGDVSANEVLAGPTTGADAPPSYRTLVAADIPPVTNLAGGSGGTIPYQSAANTTQMLANGSAGQVLASQGTTVAPHYITLPSILAFTSAAGSGSMSGSEVMTVTGLLATDTILSVSQSVPGGNSLPLLGFNTLANDALTAVFSADPGAGAVIVVAVKR